MPSGMFLESITGSEISGYVGEVMTAMDEPMGVCQPSASPKVVVG